MTACNMTVLRIYSITTQKESQTMKLLTYYDDGLSCILPSNPSSTPERRTRHNSLLFCKHTFSDVEIHSLYGTDI